MAKTPEYNRHKMKRGWYNVRTGANPRYESYRHSLARYGIKSKGLKAEEMKQKLDIIKAQQSSNNKMFKTYEAMRKSISKQGYRDIVGMKAQITEEDYDYFLNVLPPLRWKGSTFYMREFLSGDATMKFSSKGGKYFAEVVNYKKEFPKMTQQEYMMDRFG